MKWFKKIFGSKAKEEKKEEFKQEEVVEEPKGEIWKECFYCKQPIYKKDKWSKQSGNYYHRKCYKEMLSQF